MHNEICQLLASSCTHPETEIIEYLKRDLANVALGNKDNHTRNTAIQRTEHGLVQLTPVFDFAPMWLHPDGIARTTRWQRDDQGGSPLWVSVIEQIAELSSVSTETLRQVLKQQLPIYESLLSYMYAIHMDPEIIENSTVRIRNICQQLNEL
jgi:serine/threonine-protein kinase HipA